MPDFSMGRYSLAIVGFDPAVVGMEPLTFLHVPWNTAAWGALFLALVALAWVLAALDAGCAAGVLGAHVPAFVGLGGLYALTHWQGSEYLGALLQMGALALLVPSLVVVGWRIFRARRFAFACAWPPALIALVCGVFITFAVDQWSLGGGLFCAGASAVVAAIPFILAGVLAGQSRRAGAGWLGFFLGLLASGIAGTVTAVLLSEDLRYLFIAGIMVGLALAWPVMAVRLALRRGGGWSRPLLFLTLSWGLAVGSILLFQDEIRFAGLCLLLAALAGMALYRLWRGARGLRAGLRTQL
ncbi:hypothetical protein HS125_14345 [bacterium]|nr:hypothetical protein [bacterium]